jgi:membrane protease YdiL (CAAX protease family)
MSSILEERKEKMQKKGQGIVIYLLITFGVAWLNWLLAWIIAGSATTFQFSLLVLPAAFAPALASIVMRRWVTREGFADAGLRPHLKAQWRYYLIAYLWPLPVVALLLLLILLFGLARPDFSLQRGLALLQPGLHLPSSTIWLLHWVIPLGTTPILWGEEFGWQGYLLIRMRELFGSRPLLGVLLTGMIWGLWHIPLHVMGYFHDDHVLIDTILYVVTLILLFMVMSWLRFKTGSVWASSLAHASNNSFLGSLTLFLFLGGGNLTYDDIPGLIPLGILCGWIIFSGQLKPILAVQTHAGVGDDADCTAETVVASSHDQSRESFSQHLPRL